MKKLLLTALASFALFNLQAQTQQSKVSKTTKEKESPKTVIKDRPADFPKYVDTGNPETDKANYYAAKRAWMENHHSSSAKTGKSHPASSGTAKTPKDPEHAKKTIAQADFDKLPESKRQHILAHPEWYEVK